MKIKIFDNNGEVTFYGCSNMFLFDLSYEGIDIFNSIGESIDVIGMIDGNVFKFKE